MNEEKVQRIFELINVTINGSYDLESKIADLDTKVKELQDMGTFELDQPIISRAGILGKIIICIKRFFRKFTRWYVKPAFDYQNLLNKKERQIFGNELLLLQDIINAQEKQKYDLELMN